MKLRAEIEVPENSSWQTIEDAKLKAPWHRVISNDERMEKTDLCNKCGTCRHFCPKEFYRSKCYGDCLKGRRNRARYSKACKAYERINND